MSAANSEEDGELPRYFYEDFSEFDADAAKHLRPVASALEVVRDKLSAITGRWSAEAPATRFGPRGG